MVLISLTKENAMKTRYVGLFCALTALCLTACAAGNAQKKADVAPAAKAAPAAPAVAAAAPAAPSAASDGNKKACVCAKGKAGETVWCDGCSAGYVKGTKTKCKGCFTAKSGGEPCKDCAGS